MTLGKPDLVYQPDGQSRELRNQELKHYRDEIEVYLHEPYFFELPDDPAAVGNYSKTGYAMARSNNVLEIIKKMEYLCHPKVSLIDQASKDRLNARIKLLQELLTPTWIPRKILEAQDDARLPQDWIQKIEQEVSEGEQMDREFRTQIEMRIIQGAIRAAVKVLDKELK